MMVEPEEEDAPDTTTPEDSVVETPATATDDDTAPTFTDAPPTFTPGTLTMMLRGGVQQPFDGVGVAAGTGMQQVVCAMPTEAELAASRPIPTHAAMFRHETFIVRLLRGSPAAMQRSNQISRQARTCAHSGTHFPPRNEWPVDCDTGIMAAGVSGFLGPACSKKVWNR